MHDIRLIRDNPAAFDAALARRGLAPLSGELLALDESRRARITDAETAQAERNAASKQAGQAKSSGDTEKFDHLRALMAAKKDQIAALEAEAATEDQRLAELVTQGVLAPVIEHRFPLAEAPAAYAISETGHARGKTVLEI